MISQEKVAGEPVSRILSPYRPRKQPYRGGDHSSDAAYPGVVVPTNRNKGPGRSLPCRSGAPPLFGLAPRGVCQPSRSLGTRWALTPPFHPCRGASSRRLAATRPLLDRSLVAVCSLWRCPSPRDVALGASSWRRPFGDAFGSALPSGVRTFLPRQPCDQRERSPGSPASWNYSVNAGLLPNARAATARRRLRHENRNSKIENRKPSQGDSKGFEFLRRPPVNGHRSLHQFGEGGLVEQLNAEGFRFGFLGAGLGADDQVAGLLAD